MRALVKNIKKDVRGPYAKVPTKTSKRRTVQCMVPSRRQNGRRNVGREKKDGSIIKKLFWLRTAVKFFFFVSKCCCIFLLVRDSRKTAVDMTRFAYK